jgi:lysophospholipase L1-like esterase
MKISRRKFVAFVAIPWFVAAGIVALGWRYYSLSRDSEAGKNLNADAWNASYSERNLRPPVDGPREGFWMSRLGGKQEHATLGWVEKPNQIPGKVAVEQDGLQYYRSRKPSPATVMIVGGSVAWGSYASSIANTYFHVLGEELDRGDMPANLIIVAAGAWKSSQELAALEICRANHHVDVVVLLDGLNDLTNGPTAAQPYDFNSMYHAGDFDERVRLYLGNVHACAVVDASQNIDTLVVLQPSLYERAHPSSLEQKLILATVFSDKKAEELRKRYQEMRDGLEKLAKGDEIKLLDASRLFDAERATTFSDSWHFSDHGHEILGKAIAPILADMLRSRRSKAAER